MTISLPVFLLRSRARRPALPPVSLLALLQLALSQFSPHVPQITHSKKEI